MKVVQVHMVCNFFPESWDESIAVASNITVAKEWLEKNHIEYVEKNYQKPIGKYSWRDMDFISPIGSDMDVADFYIKEVEVIE